MGARRANPIDLRVGNRIKLRREELGLSQSDLGRQLGISYQQIQKYERGNNRVGAGRLFQFAKLLKVPLAYFYADAEDSAEQQRPQISKEAFEIAREIDAVQNNKQRQLLAQAIRSIIAAFLQK